jgi:chemotaxis protein MotA
MDIGTIAGLLIAFGMMAVSIIMGGGSFSSMWDTASVLMVFGGAAGVVLICYPLSNTLKLFVVIKKTMLNRPPDVQKLIVQLVSLAETARKDGLLALEARMDEINDPFIKLGIQMSVDGQRPEVIEDILRTDIDSMALRHKEGKAVIDSIGKYAPAMGMIGTLLGLIIMLGQMSDPSKIGAGMAVALITTLYGAVLSNGSFLPFSDKLAFLSRQEVVAREIVVRGIMAIQSGENPRVIEQKLSTFLPPSKRKKEEKK